MKPGFHVKDNVFFNRLDNGDVEISDEDKKVVIEEATWTSIVTHVAHPDLNMGLVNDAVRIIHEGKNNNPMDEDGNKLLENLKKGV